MTLWQVPLSALWMILTFNIVIGVTIFPLEDVADILKGSMTLPFLDGCLRRMTSIESKSVCPRIYELWQSDFIAGRETNRPQSAQYIRWYWHELKNFIVLYLYMCNCRITFVVNCPGYCSAVIARKNCIWWPAFHGRMHISTAKTCRPICNPLWCTESYRYKYIIYHKQMLSIHWKYSLTYTSVTQV